MKKIDHSEKILSQVNESVNEDEDVTNNRRSKNIELNTQEDFYVISAKRVDSEKND